MDYSVGISLENAKKAIMNLPLLYTLFNTSKKYIYEYECDILSIIFKRKAPLQKRRLPLNFDTIRKISNWKTLVSDIYYDEMEKQIKLNSGLETMSTFYSNTINIIYLNIADRIVKELWCVQVFTRFQVHFKKWTYKPLHSGFARISRGFARKASINEEKKLQNQLYAAKNGYTKLSKKKCCFHLNLLYYCSDDDDNSSDWSD